MKKRIGCVKAGGKEVVGGVRRRGLQKRSPTKKVGWGNWGLDYRGWGQLVSTDEGGVMEGWERSQQ